MCEISLSGPGTCMSGLFVCVCVCVCACVCSLLSLSFILTCVHRDNS